MADYGLDPSLVNYVQGNGMPPQGAPMPAPPPQYGLDPSVVAGLQNGFAPTPAMPAQAPQRFGIDPSIAGAPGSPSVADTQVPSVTGGALPTIDASVQATPPPDALPVANSPDRVIGTASPLTDRQMAATNKVYAAQQAQAAAYANTPEAIAEKADAENRAVVEKERQAQADADTAEIAKNEAVAKAQADSADRQAKQETIAAAQRAKDQADTQQYAQHYAQQIKDAADFKINTNRDIGMGGIIAVALSGIGDAIAHRNGPNAALEIINKRIDANIADQWAQKRSLGEAASGTKDLLETSRQTASDDRQDQDVAKAAELQAVKNQIATITAQSANPAYKARGEQLQAGLDQQSAGLTMALANRKLEAQKVAADQAMKRSELGVQYGHLSLAREEHKDALKQQDREFALAVERANAEGGAKAAAATAAQAQKLKEDGVYDPGTGNVLLDASAASAITQAKRLDAQAASATDPKQQAALAEQAQRLRTDAKLQYGSTVTDKDGALKKQMIGAQRLVDATQRIRDELDNGGLADRDTRARLKTEADNAFTSWAELNGVKASSREYEVYKDAVGTLDGYKATNVDKGPLKASLDALDTGTKDSIGALLRSHGIKAVDEDGNPYVMQAKKPVEATKVAGTTSVEKATGSEPSVVTKVLGVDLRHPFTSPEERNPVNVENAADFSLTGLTKEDDSKVLGLIKTYGRVSTDENSRVVSSLVNLVGNPGDDERKQAIANSVITRVRGESPQLYAKMLDALPAPRRKEITQFQVLDPSIMKGMGWRK